MLPLTDPSNDVPILGPIGVGVGTLGTTWQQILPSDPQRRGMVVHNPGTNNLYIAPANLPSQPSTGAGALLIYPNEEAEIYASNEYENVNAAWMGWVSAGSFQPVSILNFTGTNASVAAPAPLAYLNQGSVIVSPVATGVILGTTLQSIIGSNAQRRGIAFHNPSTAAVAVMPANISVSFGAAGSIIVLPGDTKTFRSDISSRIRVNVGWNAIAQVAGANPLTVLEFLG